jgi:hypothetical protein
VPPETTTLSREYTQPRRNSTASGVIDPKRIRSSVVSGFFENFRIVRIGPVSAIGGMMALTRLPSGSRASAIGWDSSQRRPSGAMMRSMMRITCSSS